MSEVKLVSVENADKIKQPAARVICHMANMRTVSAVYLLNPATGRASGSVVILGFRSKASLLEVVAYVCQ